MKSISISLSRIGFECCKNCTLETGRYSGCHSSCEKYIETKKRIEEDKERIRNMQKGRDEMIGFYSQKKLEMYDGNKHLKDRFAKRSEGLKKNYE